MLFRPICNDRFRCSDKETKQNKNITNAICSGDMGKQENWLNHWATEQFIVIMGRTLLVFILSVFASLTLYLCLQNLAMPISFIDFPICSSNTCSYFAWLCLHQANRKQFEWSLKRQAITSFMIKKFCFFSIQQSSWSCEFVCVCSCMRGRRCWMKYKKEKRVRTVKGQFGAVKWIEKIGEIEIAKEMDSGKLVLLSHLTRNFILEMEP